MALSKRLQIIGDLVPSGNRIIDIGCDHALLDIYLIKSKKIKKALAIDIHAKALSGAIKNIQNSKLNDNIEVKLNDGLKNIHVFSDDIIVVAGMGTRNIIKILEKHVDVLNNVIVQANNEHFILRKWFSKHGFKIVNEVFIIDHKKAYIIMALTKGSNNYNKYDYWLGPILKNDSIYINYLISYYKKLYDNVPKKYFIKRYQVKRKTMLLKKKSWSSFVSV